LNITPEDIGEYIERDKKEKTKLQEKDKSEEKQENVQLEEEKFDKEHKEGEMEKHEKVKNKRIEDEEPITELQQPHKKKHKVQKEKVIGIHNEKQEKKGIKVLTNDESTLINQTLKENEYTAIEILSSDSDNEHECLSTYILPFTKTEEMKSTPFETAIFVLEKKEKKFLQV